METPVRAALNAKARLSPNGRIVIPAAVREQMGVKPGEWLYMDFEDGALRIETFPARIRRIQREVAKYIRPGVSVVDELISERREEARREEEETQRWLEEDSLRSEGKIA